MHSTLTAITFAAALTGGAHAQQPSASTSSTTTPSSSRSIASASEKYIYATSDILQFVSTVAPTATLSPAQVSRLYQDINQYQDVWDSIAPEDPLQTDISIPNGLFISIESAENIAQTNPTLGLASLSALVTGLPASSAIMAYETSLLQAEATWTTNILKIVSSDIAVPSTSSGSATSTATGSAVTSASISTSSGLAAAPTAGPGVMIGAVAAAAGVVGMAML
ncbi:MAG: hypothetical protein LQ340_001648 [Diploschistes diacapsis]|nr:MAG: hypothetical protein LQ340_001648 [Diploschistes diacapsis]